MISAPSSGTGKTMLMLGLLTALRARGLAVQPFKSGPDYIDPAFHLAASGRASFNLDSWAMDAGRIAAHTGGQAPADLVLAEGSMGLFDGVALPGETSIGASAEITTLMGWPVVLVLDVSGQAQSAAATARGFAKLQPDLPFAGVVLNRVASPQHEALIRRGMDPAGITILGALSRQGNIEMPERHLGLVQAEETTELQAMLDRTGSFVAGAAGLGRSLALRQQPAHCRAAGGTDGAGHPRHPRHHRDPGALRCPCGSPEPDRRAGPEITTGRQLRDHGWPESADTLVVTLDCGYDFRTLPPQGVHIWWGAFLGMAEQITCAGPLAEAGPRIERLRVQVRADHGWIMDIYLLRRG